MRVLGFTGTRSLNPHLLDVLAYLRRAETRLWLESFDVYVTGACIGWDAFVGRRLALTFPDKIHIVVVPADRSRVDPWWEEFDPGFVKVMYMDEGTDYRSRNEKIVELAVTEVFYCADYPENHPKSKRSGTWMTKRIAERAGRRVTGIILNNDDKDKETHE